MTREELDERIARARDAEKRLRDEAEAAEQEHEEAVSRLRKLEALVTKETRAVAAAGDLVERIRRWLAHETLVGLSRHDVALIERLAADLEADVIAEVRRAA